MNGVESHETLYQESEREKKRNREKHPLNQSITTHDRISFYFTLVFNIRAFKIHSSMFSNYNKSRVSLFHLWTIHILYNTNPPSHYTNRNHFKRHSKSITQSYSFQIQILLFDFNLKKFRFQFDIALKLKTIKTGSEFLVFFYKFFIFRIWKSTLRPSNNKFYILKSQWSSHNFWKLCRG